MVFLGGNFLFRISELTQRERIYVHFANYRFSFRKLQIPISQTTDFHFVSSHFVSQTTVSLIRIYNRTRRSNYPLMRALNFPPKRLTHPPKTFFYPPKSLSCKGFPHERCKSKLCSMQSMGKRRLSRVVKIRIRNLW